MRTMLLGRSGLRVSELCLGTMTFGEDWGWGASRDESRRVFDAYVRAGGNFVDTACNYTNGTSEKFVGEFVGSERERFVIATKFSLTGRKDDPNGGGNSRKNLVQSLEGSLARLGTDYVDLLYVHMWDFTTPIEEVMRALDDVIRAGKVLYAGVSDTPSWVVSRANLLADLRGLSPFVALQVPHSLVRRDVERDLLPMADSLGLTVMSWGVLASGILSGKYNDAGSPPEQARLKPGTQSLTPQNLRIAAEVSAVAGDLGRTPSQVAINWERQRRGGSTIPILAATRLAQFEDNLGCLDFELSEEHRKRLDAVTGFERGFPMDFLESENVQNLLHGDARSRMAPWRHRG